MSFDNVKFEDLKGKIFIEIIVNKDTDEIVFIEKNGSGYKLYHKQECCESVTIEDISGDINDLLNTPIIISEEITNASMTNGYDEYYTWTFYKLATVKGYVDIRWYGTSNGYYSESVDFVKIE